MAIKYGFYKNKNKESIMELWKKLLVIGCILAIMVPVFGCSEEGPMEKAGKQLDQAADDAADAAKKIFE
jgi:hypothetical protein